ncbi:MAG TPA: prepilin-type N-terminal cleavage/methylation domain-containing protein [Burkholderiaceae bacterium]|nr:prepilin-type N-terminal cleavage/methylation domain-containing protein [Burkholderiaceae bacterium]
MNLAPPLRRPHGFTLIELVTAVAILAILATIAAATYLLYVVRAQLAQTLVDYDHIRTVVNIETYASDRENLHLGSQPGKVPPPLDKQLDEREFNQLDGVTLQLVRAPAGTFASFPNDAVYALIARADNDAGVRRIRVLRQVLPHGEGDKVWLSAQELYFPLDVAGGDSQSGGGGGDTPAPPPPEGGTSWGDGDVSKAPDGTWSASARVCVMGTDGKPLTGINAQVQIRVVQEIRGWDGQVSERQWQTQSAIVDGCASFKQTGAPVPGDGKEGVSAYRFEVIDVIYYWPENPPVRWDGVKPVMRLEVPA